MMLTLDHKKNVNLMLILKLTC